MDDVPAPGALPDPFPARSRGNGLPAATFVPLLAVDARVTGDVLATLATASIAAYSRPRSADQDEVFSDARRRADARSLLAVRLPEVLPAPSAGDDVDATFAEIVAGWDLPTLPGAGAPDGDVDRLADTALHRSGHDGTGTGARTRGRERPARPGCRATFRSRPAAAIRRPRSLRPAARAAAAPARAGHPLGADRASPPASSRSCCR